MPVKEEDREELIAYLDGEVDEETARRVEARITVDPKARAEAESLRQAWDLLDFLPKPEPSPNFTNRTLDRLTLRESMSGLRIRQLGAWPRWVKGIGWAAALLLAAGFGFSAAYLLWGRPGTEKREATEIEKTLVRDLRTIENMELYETIDDLKFLKKLEKNGFFEE
jgi:anti-sigma factor RsiW